MATKNTYSKNEKLKSRKALEGLFAAGKSFSVFPIKVFYTLSEEVNSGNDSELSEKEKMRLKRGNVHAGVGVSSRIFKKANDRNKVKRLLREVYRTQKQPLYAAMEQKTQSLDVFFLYVGKELPAFAPLKETMEKVLDKLARKITETENHVQQL